MIRRRTTLFAPALLLARCGAAPPPPPELMLTVQAGADQNPDPSGHPAPVAIRLYQLAALGNFLHADVFALLDRQAETLGADGLASEELIVAPGERQTMTHALQPATRFIGVIALFRAIDQATWRIDTPAAPNGPTRLTLATHANTLTASTS